ncbi:MAG: hypothetical protein LQ340_004663 [Diploschistes diacapsis]|nr:MAG: hypothetical protein LQ340_004663 [Diploschistes diacapsis]
MDLWPAVLLRRVAAAHKHLQYLIKTKGPFDGVLGFSQGAALAASLLLHHQINSPDQPAPFKAAIFICSPVPFSTSVEYGIDTRAYFGIETMQLSRPHCPDQVPKHLITDPAYLNGEVETGQDGQHSTFYQMFHPTVDTCRIAVPTLHVYGKRDKWRLHSRDLYELCEPATANCLEHDAGHEVPAAYAEEIADAVESTMFKGR